MGRRRRKKCAKAGSETRLPKRRRSFCLVGGRRQPPPGINADERRSARGSKGCLPTLREEKTALTNEDKSRPLLVRRKGARQWKDPPTNAPKPAREEEMKVVRRQP